MTASRKIILTGATRGIGRAMAYRFAELGHTVYGCGRSQALIDERNQDLNAKNGFFTTLDVSSDAQVTAWAEHVLAEIGAPDLVLNNAAVINPNAPLWTIASGEFDKVIDINLKGSTHVIRHYLPAMIRRGRGVVVNFTSGWGRSTAPEVAPYCATKWALEGMTMALAQELPQGIAAVTLNPGVIHTRMLVSCFGEENAGTHQDPEVWADRAVPFLLRLGPQHNGRQLTVPP